MAGAVFGEGRRVTSVAPHTGNDVLYVKADAAFGEVGG